MRSPTYVLLPVPRPAVASGQGTCVGGKPATRTYQLRTRSSSLRAAWVEMEPEGKATGAAAEASTDSDGECGPGVTVGMEQASALQPLNYCLNYCLIDNSEVSPTAWMFFRVWSPAGEAAQSGSDKEDEEEQQQKQEEKEKAPSRKRVGRPLAYNGDPDAPHLTDQERRKIKR